MPVKTVIFDVGGVFTLSPFHSFDEVGVSRGAKPGQVHDIVFGGYGQDGDHPWHQLERGEITLEQCRDALRAISRDKYDLELDIYDLFAALPRDGGIRRTLVNRVARLKQDGYRTAIITNNVKEFSDGWRSLMPVDQLFDLVVDSCEVGMRKPAPGIFHYALAELGDPEPASCVFLDDFPGNCAAAAKLGLQTVLVGDSIDEAIAELDGILAAV